MVPFNCLIAGLANFGAGKKPLEYSVEACWEDWTWLPARPGLPQEPFAALRACMSLEMKSRVYGALISHRPLVHFSLILGPCSPFYPGALELLLESVSFHSFQSPVPLRLPSVGHFSNKRFAKDLCSLSHLTHPIMRELTGYFTEQAYCFRSPVPYQHHTWVSFLFGCC